MERSPYGPEHVTFQKSRNSMLYCRDTICDRHHAIKCGLCGDDITVRCFGHVTNPTHFIQNEFVGRLPEGRDYCECCTYVMSNGEPVHHQCLDRYYVRCARGSDHDIVRDFKSVICFVKKPTKVKSANKRTD